ncbi:MAG: septation protein SpoVG family protein [Candidatus Omnitrophota bacterium]|nr:septation protein SpoVG family protein [Candidatus Omnitrophota bacterium]MBU1894666.1 septation protein SpoVG family protein [Candidatus Omnitrophota bacterium]
MKITEVRIFPTESKDGKLKAFATMTFDDWFVVRNVKVIQGNNGLFVAMPSRKAVEACSKCRFKNVVGSKYCNQCGSQLKEISFPQGNDENDKYNSHMDIAHPITQDCRVYIQDRILDAYMKDKHEKTGEGASLESSKKEKIEAFSQPVSSILETIQTVSEPGIDIGAQDIEL